MKIRKRGRGQPGHMAIPRKFVVLAALLAALAMTGTAAATVTPYYGYNYLSVNIPVGRCDPLNAVGYACSDGFNNFDRNRVYKVNGGNIGVAFLDTSYNSYGLTFCCVRTGSNPIVVLRTDVGAPPYNRTFCGYSSGLSSYVQCQWIIF